MNTNEIIYMRKELAFAEGMYKGIFMVLPSDLRIDNVDAKTVSFMFSEGAIKNTLKTVNEQIELYKNAIKGKKTGIEYKKYAPIIEALELVRIKLLNVVAKMNEPEDAGEDDYGM